jgi:hypothetical protein
MNIYEISVVLSDGEERIVFIEAESEEQAKEFAMQDTIENGYQPASAYIEE